MTGTQFNLTPPEDGDWFERVVGTEMDKPAVSDAVYLELVEVSGKILQEAQKAYQEASRAKELAKGSDGEGQANLVFMNTVEELYGAIQMHNEKVVEWQTGKKETIMAPIKESLTEVERSSKLLLDPLSPLVEQIKVEMREIVMKEGATFFGHFNRVEYVKGSLTLTDPEGLIFFAKQHPEVLKFFGQGKTYTRIVKK